MDGLLDIVSIEVEGTDLFLRERTARKNRSIEYNGQFIKVTNGNPRTSQRIGYVSNILYTLNAGLTSNAASKMVSHRSHPGSASVDFPGRGSNPFGGYETCFAK